MTIEESTNRLPYFGATRGKVIFRYAHQPLTRQNESGETESYWVCKQQLFDKKDIPAQTEEKARELCLAAIRLEAKNQIEVVAGYTQWYQNNVANGLYPPAVCDEMTDYIAQVIAESNRCEDLITSEPINQALEVVPAWPEV